MCSSVSWKKEHGIYHLYTYFVEITKKTSPPTGVVREQIMKKWQKRGQPGPVAVTSNQVALICLMTVFASINFATKWFVPNHNTLYDYLQSTQGLEGYSSGGSWTKVHSLAPVGMQEGSGVRAVYTRHADGSRRDEIWFAGGYPTDKGRVLVFDVETHQWRLPPEPQFPWPLHHCIHSMFYDKKNCRIVLLGGIRIDDGQHVANHAALTLNLCDAGVPRWLDTPLQVGGIISCSTIQLQGKYWCYAGSKEYIEETFKFFSFDLESLTIEQFPGPRLESTHVSILIDEKDETVYLSGGRDKDHNSIGKIFSFDLKTKSWSPEEIDIPFINVEDRGYIQLPDRRALLFGGQATGKNIVTDIILEFDFKTKEITLVDESPLPLFGEELVDMKNGSYFVFSGASGLGPKFSRSSWLYNPKKTQREIEASGQPVIIDATCGSAPVTLALQQHLEKMLVGFNNKPIHIPAHWCKDGLGPGNHDIVQILTITFLRDGKVRRVQCEDYNSCLLRP